MPNTPNIQRESSRGTFQLTTEATISGDFDPAYGEAHIDLSLRADFDPGNETSIVRQSVMATDKNNGATYTYSMLQRYADSKGKVALDKAIADACERFEATGERGDGR